MCGDLIEGDFNMYAQVVAWAWPTVCTSTTHFIDATRMENVFHQV